MPRSEALRAWNFDFPRAPDFAVIAAALTPGGFNIPMGLAARVGLCLAPLPAARRALDLVARADDRFTFGRDLGRALERDFARAFGRDLGLAFRRVEGVLFFILLGLRDLDLFPDRFPAMKDSYLGDELFYLRWRHSNWSLPGVQDCNEAEVPRGEFQYFGRASANIDSSIVAGSSTFSKRSIVGFPSKRWTVERRTGPSLVHASQVALCAGGFIS